MLFSLGSYHVLLQAITSGAAPCCELVFVDCQLGLKEGKMKGSTKPQRMDEPFYS